MGMDRRFLARVADNTPKMNRDIVDGLAVKFIPQGEDYIRRVWASVSLPTGLEFVDAVRCNPLQEFNEEPRKRNDRRVFEMARSDVYLMKYLFRYKGEDLPPRYVYLPYVGEAGSLMLSGARYFVSPVLSDVVLSFELNNVFVRLLRDKFAIKRTNHELIFDGTVETIPVAWALIYHVNSEQKSKSKKIKAKSSLFHYMLCRFGFTETFQRFGRCLPEIGTYNINNISYPEKEWVIVSSRQQAPREFGAKGFYQPTQIRMAIRRSEFTPLVKNMVTAFFYIVDNFPQRIEPQYLDNKRMWKILMGLILFGETKGEGGLHDDVDEHIKSLDEYMDAIIVEKFKELNMDCENIYQFFAIAIDKFNDWIMTAGEKVNSLYDKELSILYDVFSPITESIINFHFKLKTAAKKELTKSEIINTMNNHLKPRTVYALTKQPPGVSNMSYSGDNAALKITTVMFPQKNVKLKGGSEDSAQSMTDPSKRLHVSFAEIGNYCNLPKSNPTGDGRINPYLSFNAKGHVLRNEQLRPLLDEVQAMIRRD